MSIFFVNRFFFPDESATSRMITSLARALARDDFSVIVLTGRRLHDNPRVTPAPVETVDKVSVHRVWTSGFGRDGLIGRTLDYLTFHLFVFAYLLRHLRTNDICVVCTDPPMISVTALAATALKRAHLVNWIMDLFPEIAIDLGLMQPGGRTARLATWLRDLTLRHAWMNVAPIERMADLLRKRGIEASKLTVVHHWSDGDAIRPMPAEESGPRQEWGLAGKFVVGYSGNLGRAHEFGTLLDAAERLQDHPQIVFLFVGSGFRRPWVEEEVRRRRLTNVIFKPLQPKERLAESLAAADVHAVSLLPEMEPYIVPSKFYGVAAAGRPVLFIGDPGGEIAQVLGRARCGTSVPIGHGKELADAIRSMAANREACRAAGERSRQVFEAEFTEARGVGNWSRLLRTAESLSSVRRRAQTSTLPPVVRG